jgi:hypothetical protein
MLEPQAVLKPARFLKTGNLPNMDEINSNTQLKLLSVSPFEKPEREEWKQIRRDRLINSLNRINFHDEEIILNFRHTKYHKILSLAAKPQPCANNVFYCYLSESEFSEHELQSYSFENFYFTDGLKQVIVEAKLEELNSTKLKFLLPETCFEIGSRKIRRHTCHSITAQLSQDGLILEGSLNNFSAVSFSVNVLPHYLGDFENIEQNSVFHVILKKETTVCYSGTCEISRLSSSSEGSTIVLRPIKNQIQRFKSKQYRSLRQKLVPMPNAVFIHPLIGKKINLKAHDISGSGFSVEEDPENSTLIPGMIISDLCIELMNNVELTCQAQVVYRSVDEVGKIQCGFAFLDMSLKDQVSLSSLLHQAWNKKAYVCTKVDVDQLWDFFFDTDFIYPEKYSFIYENKEEFKKVYKKLYENNPEFAVNFICKDRGAVCAHLSMFRFYHKTWLINHHAANSIKSNRGGLLVLQQVSRYINEFHQFNSAVMNYVACYFRPENKFPNLVFGGVAKNVADKTSCTIDKFAYLSINKKYLDGSLAKKWSLKETQQTEIKTLQSFYEDISGGLSLHALDLLPDKIGNEEELNETYRECCFKRRKLLFTLKDKDNVIAIFMLNISAIGLNLSDLTNCIHIFILEPHNLPSDVLHGALSRISLLYDHDNIPVLIFPSSYTDNNSISINKKYNFWVLDVHKIGDRYYSYLDRLIRLSK